MKDKTKYKRFGNLAIKKQFMARFQIRSDETRKTESNNWDSVTLMNLSARDTFFYYKKDLGIGTLLDLKIDVSKFTPTINCVGKIIRSDVLHPTCVFCIAIRFIDIGEQEKELINKMAEGMFR